MANAVTIAEAETAYERAVDETKAAQTKKLKRDFLLPISVGLGGTVLASLSLLLGEPVARYLTILILVSTVGAIMVMTMVRMNHPSSIADSAEALDDLRNAQRAWIESHGFQLSGGAFYQFLFPVSPDKTVARTYGVAQLIDSTTGKLVSVALRSNPEQGYQLFGTEGEVLRPVLAAL